MAGLVLDIIVAFVLRWIIILWRKARSYRWATVTGRVVRCHLEKPGFGCNYVVLDYKYKFNFERYHGSIKKPYMFTPPAQAYIHHVTTEGELRVRVNPNKPTKSVPALA